MAARTSFSVALLFDKPDFDPLMSPVFASIIGSFPAQSIQREKLIANYA